jgi:hypothetical protein
VTDPSSLRVADADRERVASELRDHLLAGRLTSEEFEERVERAYRASTRGELDELSADLPLSPARLEAELASRRGKLRRRVLQEGGGGLSASAICTAIWLADGAGGSFWPVWVIIPSLLPLIRDGWRLLGPSPDVEAVEASLARRSRERGRGRGRGHGTPRPPRLSR